MIETKEFYIAPEVEILCFAPIQNLASSAWNWPGSGEVTESDPGVGETFPETEESD